MTRPNFIRVCAPNSKSLASGRSYLTNRCVRNGVLPACRKPAGISRRLNSIIGFSAFALAFSLAPG
jgi:hypothetical protein